MKLILVIDDDAAYANSIALILRQEGFAVISADNGAAGLEQIRASRPDLVLCDIMMPGMSGHSLLELLKGDTELADIPFIYVTALCDRADVRNGMCSGADDYLCKPFTAEELVTTVVGRLHRIELFQQRGERTAFQDEIAFLRQQTTEREREVLLLVGQGATSKEIAGRLCIRVNTVEVHRANLMRKLDAVNAATLARWAFIAEQLPAAD